MDRLLIGFVIALLGTPALAASAQSAGPEIVSSQPSGGTTVHRAPEEVTARFDKPLAPSSRLFVFDPCGKKVSSATEIDGSELRVSVSAKAKGSYVGRYSADGIGEEGSTAGTFAFTAHAGDKCKGGMFGHDDHAHMGSGGKDKPAKDANADAAARSDRVSPETSLAIALLVPVLVGGVGGFVLRRRLS